jgi:hypothetical protein
MAVLNIDTIPLGVFAELGDEIQKGTSWRVSAGGAGGAHSLDVFLAAEKPH